MIEESNGITTISCNNCSNTICSYPGIVSAKNNNSHKARPISLTIYFWSLSNLDKTIINSTNNRTNIDRIICSNIIYNFYRLNNNCTLFNGTTYKAMTNYDNASISSCKSSLYKNFNFFNCWMLILPSSSVDNSTAYSSNQVASWLSSIVSIS